MVDTTEITIAANIPESRLSIVSPCTTKEAMYNTKALITKVNNPRVNRLIGRVISSRIGLITMLTRPMTMAAKSAV